MKPKVTTVLWREGNLAHAPVVDRMGYRFLIEGKKKIRLLRTERVRKLPTAQHAWGEVGSCL